MADDGKTVNKITLLLDLIKALMWPVFAIVILVSFWRPLHEVATALPDLARSSESITIMGVSVRVGKRLAARASPDVREVLSKLSPTDVEFIITLGDTTEVKVDGNDQSDKPRLESLTALGLFEKMSAQEIKAADENDQTTYWFAAKTTPRYGKVREFLIKWMSETFEELTSQQTVK